MTDNNQHADETESLTNALGDASLENSQDNFNEQKIEDSQLNTQDIINDISEEDLQFTGMAVSQSQNNNNNNNNNNSNISNYSNISQPGRAPPSSHRRRRNNNNINNNNSIRRSSNRSSIRRNNQNNQNNNNNDINNTQNTDDLLEEDFDLDDDDDKQNSDELNASEAIYMLGIAWMNEKNCPEILEYDEEVVNKIKQVIEEQENKIDDLSDELANSIHEPGNPNTRSNFDPYALHLYNMELERVKYILNSYLRVRLWKIQEYCLYILKTPEILDRKLSLQEKKFASNYSDLCEQHLRRTFINQLPNQFRSITENEMVVKPNLDKHIVVRINDNIGNFMLESGTQNIDLTQGLILVSKYRDFKNLIEDGAVDAI